MGDFTGVGLLGSKRFQAALTLLALGSALLLWLLPPPRVVLILPEPRFDGGYGWAVDLPQHAGSFWQRAFYRVPPGDDAKIQVSLLEDGMPQKWGNKICALINTKRCIRYRTRIGGL